MYREHTEAVSLEWEEPLASCFEAPLCPQDSGTLSTTPRRYYTTMRVETLIWDKELEATRIPYLILHVSYLYIYKDPETAILL
jgi:hypothetical protein